jgi:hypothetical protein
MMSEGSDSAVCWDLAKRARRLAGTFPDGPDKRRLLRYADETEQRARELEKEANSPSAPKLIAPTPVTHSQQQVQQQQAAGPLPKPKA